VLRFQRKKGTDLYRGGNRFLAEKGGGRVREKGDRKKDAVVRRGKWSSAGRGRLIESQSKRGGGVGGGDSRNQE